MKLSPFVENAMAYALSSKEHVVALVVVAEKAMLAWAAANGRGGQTLAQLARASARPRARFEGLHACA